MMRMSGPALIGGLLLLASASCDGGPFSRKIKPSQHATVTQRVGHTEITIEYNRPVARGRALFGGIVPYGAPWNPGADQATAISFSNDVRLDGQEVKAGHYSVWMIPDPARWTFILSRAADVSHVPYPEGQDALRLPVVPRPGSHVETLAFYFPLVDSTRAELVMHWGQTVVPVRIHAP
jgi:Protein of unknown function (DUF2911)